MVEDASDVSVEHGRGRVVYGRHGGGRGSRTAVDEDEIGSEDDAELGYLWLQEQTLLTGGKRGTRLTGWSVELGGHMKTSDGNTRRTNKG